MKQVYLLAASIALLAGAACNAENNAGTSAGGGDGSSGPVEQVQRPANGDWSQAVTPTHEGGFMMGNPDAPVKLVEFGSMTCPHCAEFDENGVGPLIDNYVKNGRVAFEFRNYVRDPYDITASLIARCNGAQGFFPLTRALFKNQEDWIQKLQQVPPEQQQTLQTASPQQQFLTIADWAGLQQWAAMRGVPKAKSTQCLQNQSEIEKLVQMTSDASSSGVTGTPTFLLNGELLEQRTWDTLEPRIKEALGGR